MKIKFILIFLILLIQCYPAVQASNSSLQNYYIEFNQDGNKVLAIENNSPANEEELEKTDVGYYFVKRIKAENNYSNFIVKLNLEEGVVANPEEIFPVAFSSFSDGQTISIVWNFSNVAKGDVFAFFVSLEDKKNTPNYVWIYIIIAIALIICIFIARYFFKRKDIGKYLLDDEKKVIKLLKEADGKSLWQKNIQSTINFSKAKVSRMIRNLESRGLIEKIPIGNTNKIRLK